MSVVEDVSTDYRKMAREVADRWRAHDCVEWLDLVNAIPWNSGYGIRDKTAMYNVDILEEMTRIAGARRGKSMSCDPAEKIRELWNGHGAGGWRFTARVKEILLAYLNDRVNILAQARAVSQAMRNPTLTSMISRNRNSIIRAVRSIESHPVVEDRR